MRKQHTPKAGIALDVPLSLTELEAQCCSQCGALLPQPIGRLDQIPGQLHLRRAVVVALTGRHTITFVGAGAALPDALAFGRICRRYGLTAYATMPCPCGNFGNAYAACTCTPVALAAWRARPAFHAALSADLVVEAAHTSVEQRLAHRRGRRGETDDQLLAEAAAACERPRPPQELDGSGQRLLAAAIRQLDLTTEQIARLLPLAQSIAQLATASAITPVHLAEALQYRTRLDILPEPLEPDIQNDS
jgi:predicted ATPase with chaperone activity